MRIKLINNILFSLICFCLTICFASNVYSQEANKAGVISALEGTVEVQPRGQLIYNAAQLNQVLYAGDRIRTKDDGWVQISLDNSNVVTLKENSDLLIEKFVQNLDSGEYENILEMNLGKLRAKVEKLKGSSVFEIHTPTAVAAARGTIIYIEASSELAKLLVEEGVVDFSSKISGMKVSVKDGETSSAYRDGVISNPCIPSAGQKAGHVTGFSR
ncbi:MAG: FecR domain-containing protein [Candidatus Omnitrophica bacterium]|nr:FecR domain-containing protein [Candidatus Omnitrophota bacterium]